MVRHIVKATDLGPRELKQIFRRASSNLENRYQPQLPGKLIALLFYQPSTRTEFSFDTAIKRLGGNSIGTSNAQVFSSAAKGETLEDTIRVVSGFADCVVLRHPERGAAERAAAVSLKPVINAGDGDNEHPTQAYLDLYTIWKARQEGRLSPGSLRILFYGDNLHSRTVRSLVQLLASHAPELDIPIRGIDFFGPRDFGFPSADVFDQMPEDSEIRTGIKRHTKLPPLSDIDVVYVTRPQVEYHAGKQIERTPLTIEMMGRLQEKSIIMHPLPRNEEIPKEIDTDHRAAYFEQSDNGVLLRMALLWHLLHQKV